MNYTKSRKIRGQNYKYRIDIQPPPANYPLRVRSHKSGFMSLVQVGIKGYLYKPDRLDPNHHENFMNEGTKYFIHSPYELFSKDSTSY